MTADCILQPPPMSLTVGTCLRAGMDYLCILVPGILQLDGTFV